MRYRESLRSRSGFTLVEVLLVVAIIGILANIALPMLRGAVYKADAAAVISDFKTIQIAALQRFANEGTYPASEPWTRVPSELADYLPDGFEFTYKNVDYRWRRWSLPSGRPRRPRQTLLVGVQVRTQDRALMTAIKKLYKGGQAQGRNNHVTFVIE